MRVTPRERSSLRCAYCHGELTGWTEPCHGCGTTVHPECRAADGRCPTLGCRAIAMRAPRAAIAAASRVRRRGLRLRWALFLAAWTALVAFAAATPLQAALDIAYQRAATPIDPEIAEQLTVSTDADLLAACRALLDVPANHGGMMLTSQLPPAIRARSPLFVQVHPRAVVIGLQRGKGLVAMREGFYVELEVVGEPDRVRVDAVIPGLWRYTTW